MLPWITVDSTKTPDGTDLVLARRGTEWEVTAGRLTLMSNRKHGSERELARLAFEKAPAACSVLLGGLGLGFSLRAALDLLPSDGRIVLAELLPEIVRWNREHVGELAGHPLCDPRVQVSMGDVYERIAEAPDRYDAILLDVDNGPVALVQESNDRLYGEAGIRKCLRALRQGGVLTVWSAGPDEGYLRRLRRAGFDASAKSVLARPGGAKRHVVFVARKETAPLVATGPPAPARGSSRGGRSGRVRRGTGG